MSGVQGHILGHIVRRGVQHFSSLPADDRISQLNRDAMLYENAGQEMEINPREMLPILITGFIVLLITASIKYTVGEVVASLSMIESQTSTAIIEDKPPAYADEPDAPLVKEGLLPAEAVADVEVTMIHNVPVTAKIRTTVKHLHRVGGFRARWRGAGLSFLYHFVHSAAVHVFSSIIGGGMITRAIAYILVSVATSRLHMLWTHSMIAAPSAKPWYRRFVARKDAKAVLLPSFVFALAQQATIFLPMAVASFVIVPTTDDDFKALVTGKNNGALFGLSLGFLAVPATALFVALAILLPAAVTLTRVEALLLPEGEETIVPFDRQAIMAGVDTTKKCQAGALFTSAWRSFDRAARWRLIKLYIKMTLMQMAVLFIGFHVMLAELYIIGGERLALLIKSGSAQLKLMAIEAQKEQ